MKYFLSVCPSILPSECFLGIGSLDFPELWHGDRDPYEVVRDRAEVFGKNFFLLQKLGKWAKNGPKIGSFEFKEIFEEIEFKLILI